MVCGHLADALTEVGARLRSTAAGRTRRAACTAPYPYPSQRYL